MKIRGILMAAACVLFMQPASFAQSRAQKAADKAVEYGWKDKLKQLKKEDAVFVSGGDAEVIRHWQKVTRDETAREIIGEVEKCRSTDTGIQVAQNNAQVNYANLLNAKVDGISTKLTSSNDSVPAEEFNKTAKVALTSFSADVSGLLTLSYSYYTMNPDGTKHFVSVYRVNKSDERDSYAKSLEHTLKETKMTIEQTKSMQALIDDMLK